MATLNDIKLYFARVQQTPENETPFAALKGFKAQGGSVEEAATAIETRLKSAGISGAIDKPDEITYFTTESNIQALFAIIDGKAKESPLKPPKTLKEAVDKAIKLISAKGHEGEGLLEYLDLCESSADPIIKAFALNLRDNLPRSLYGDANTKKEFSKIEKASSDLKTAIFNFGEDSFKIDPNKLAPLPDAKIILLRAYLSQYLNRISELSSIDSLKTDLTPEQILTVDLIVAEVVQSKDIKIVDKFTEKEIIKARIRYALDEHFQGKVKGRKKDLPDFYTTTIRPLIARSTSDKRLQDDLQEFYKKAYGAQRTQARDLKMLRFGNLLQMGGGAMQALGLPDLGSLLYGGYRNADAAVKLVKSLISMFGKNPRPFNPFLPIEELSDSDKKIIYSRNVMARILGNIPSLSGYQQEVFKGTLGLTMPPLIGLTQTAGMLNFQRQYAALAGQIDLNPTQQAEMAISAAMGIANIFRLKETIGSNNLTQEYIEHTPDDTQLPDLYDPDKQIHFDDVPKVDDAGPFFSTLNWDGWRRLNIDQILALDSMNLTSDLTRLTGRRGTGAAIAAGVAIAKSLASFIPLNRWEVPLTTQYDSIRNQIYSDPKINLTTFVESLVAQTAGIGGSLLADGDSRVQQVTAEILPRMLTEWQHTSQFAGMVSNHDSLPFVGGLLDGAIATIGDFKSGVMLGQLASERLGANSGSTGWERAQVAILMGMQAIKTGLGWASAGIEASKRPADYQWRIYTAEAGQTVGALAGLAFGFIGPKGNDKVKLNPEWAPGNLVGGRMGRADKDNDGHADNYWAIAPSFGANGSAGFQISFGQKRSGSYQDPDETA